MEQKNKIKGKKDQIKDKKDIDDDKREIYDLINDKKDIEEEITDKCPFGCGQSEVPQHYLRCQQNPNKSKDQRSNVSFVSGGPCRRCGIDSLEDRPTAINSINVVCDLLSPNAIRGCRSSGSFLIFRSGRPKLLQERSPRDHNGANVAGLPREGLDLLLRDDILRVENLDHLA